MYALLKTLHVLAIVVWIGGMSFAHFCLRPAAMRLDPPQRVALMHDALSRFFALVAVAATVTVLTGIGLIARVATASVRAGASVALPVEWHVMATLGVAMIAIFAYVRLVLHRRLSQAVGAADWPSGAAALASIRRWVVTNLVLGTTIIAVTVLGAGG